MNARACATVEAAADDAAETVERLLTQWANRAQSGWTREMNLLGSS